MCVCVCRRHAHDFRAVCPSGWGRYSKWKRYRIGNLDAQFVGGSMWGRCPIAAARCGAVRVVGGLCYIMNLGNWRAWRMIMLHGNFIICIISGMGGMVDRLAAALWWLDRGADLLPVQPGSKHLVGGFGPYQRRISDQEGARFWFGDRGANLAICTGGVVALDFDSVAAYQAFCDSWGDVCAQTLREKTTRGYHVYFAGDSETGTLPAWGAEVKGRHGFVVVAPSVVAGVIYSPVVGGGSSLARLPDSLSLSENLSEGSPGAALGRLGGDVQGFDVQGDTIARIKAAWSVLSLVADSGKAGRIRGRGRWRNCRCVLPGHEDRHGSFWVDTARGLWGCHGCGAHGDVVNLYARLHGVSVQQAIRDMAVTL